ncbi:MAG TPA: hypothetical protein VMH33_04735 [Solirubrobacterales bacterium]|nr:hypothetical protein [Solirubrobacterales bacterium]
MGAALVAPSAQADCPNEAIRIEQGASYLPGCMALEQATPPVKYSAPTLYPSFSADGERLLFKSTARLGDSTSYVNPLGDFYVAGRGAGGWSTSATTAPGSFGFGEQFAEVPLAFTSDFGAWVSFGSTRAQYFQGEAKLWEGTSAGSWSVRSPLLASIWPGRVLGLNERAALLVHEVVGASPDLSHVVAQAGKEVAWLSGDPQPPKLPSILEPANSYLIADGSGGEPTIQLLARDSSGAVWGGNCGAWLGGGGTSKEPGGRNQGAISGDGSRILFSTRPGQPWNPETNTGPSCEVERPIRIMVREETPTGPQVFELLPAAPAIGSDFFEGASEDQSRIYFTSSRALLSTDLDTGVAQCSATLGGSNGCDLYLYETTPSGYRIVDVSAGGAGDPTPGEGADVLKGVTAISGDGSRVYFVAQGVLTTDPNAEGATAEAGKANLYTYDADTGNTTFIGVVTSADAGKLYGSTSSHPGSVVAVPMLGESDGRQLGGDGHVLLFQSTASLTYTDTDGGHLDIYRYDAAATPPTLECVSCRPGGPDPEPLDVGPRANIGRSSQNTEFAEWERWADEGGDGIVFATKEALLPEDTDGGELSDYLWLGGHLTLLPGNGAQPTISHSGAEVAFETPRALLPTDTDTAIDIYVAREAGGFPGAPRMVPCASEACQGPAVAQPAPVAAAGTASFQGTGNQKAPSGCPKSKAHKNRRCVKKHHHRERQKKKHAHHKHKKKHGHGKQAGGERGGKK